MPHSRPCKRLALINDLDQQAFIIIHRELKLDVSIGFMVESVNHNVDAGFFDHQLLLMNVHDVGRIKMNIENNEIERYMSCTLHFLCGNATRIMRHETLCHTRPGRSGFEWSTKDCRQEYFQTMTEEMDWESVNSQESWRGASVFQKLKPSGQICQKSTYYTLMMQPISSSLIESLHWAIECV